MRLTAFARALRDDEWTEATCRSTAARTPVGAATICLFALLAGSPTPARADVVVLRHIFSAADAEAAGAELGEEGGVTWLVLHGASEEPKPVVSLEVPPPPHAVLEIRGVVRGRDLSPPAQIVVWLDYGEGHRYRVATDGSGPTAPLEGTFEARDFRIPYAGREGDTLRKLEVTLSLPGRGAVALGDVRVVSLDQRGLPARMRPWFSTEDVKPLFMPLGLGLLGALLFAGLLAMIGRLRGLSLGILRLGGIAGLLTFAAGGAGLSRGQPPDVYLPLLGAGGIVLVFALLSYGPTARRFKTAEAKRMPRLK